MKKLVLLVAGMLLLAGPALAVIDKSAHDLPQTWGTGNASDEVCVFCHTPHGANVAFTGGPLWNRNESSTTLVGKYSSATLNAVIDASNNYKEIDAAACLCCHDGSQAMSTLVNPPNTGLAGTYGNITNANKILGSNMNNDHPVNFDYEAVAAADTEIKAYASLPAVLQKGFKISGSNHIMQCSSCHDVHNTTGARLILINNAGSNLCLACHIK